MTHSISKLVCLFAFLMFSFASKAQVRYVTDDFEIMLRTGPSIQNKIVKPLGSGTKLDIVNEESDNGYSLVQTQQGEQGYVLTRFLSSSPSARSRLAYLEDQLQKLRSKPGELQTLLADSQDENRSLISLNTQLSTDLKSTKDELDEIKRVSSNAVELAQRNNELEEKVHQLILQLDDVRMQNESIEDQQAQRWFMIGGAWLAFGLFLGWLLSIYRRPRRNSWGM